VVASRGIVSGGAAIMQHPQAPVSLGALGFIPLLGRSALQLVENQLAMLLEYAQRPFERMEHRLSNWLKMKNPACSAVKREAEEDWGH